jgi:hypothetical protein
MGIHFVCHHCSYALHVKDFQAGKRGKCPHCRGSFRIPANDASYSSPLEDASESAAVANLRSAFEQDNDTAVAKLNESSSDSVAIAIETSSLADTLPRESKKKTVVPSKSMDASKSSEKKTTKKEREVSPVLQELADDAPLTLNSTMPSALIQSGEAKWFVRPPSGGQFGPASLQLLMTWITESRVTAESYLWREGLADWQLASVLVPELFSNGIEPSSEPPSLTDVLSGDPSSLLPSADLKLDSEIALRSGLLLKKQMQKRRQQLTMIVILGAVSLVLFGILIFVLVFQATKPPQPNALDLGRTLEKHGKSVPQ